MSPTSSLPGEVATIFAKPGFGTAVNMGASLGAVTVERGEVFVGSRLTVYEGDDEAWAVQLPLLLLSIIGSADALVGAISQAFDETEGEAAESAWKERDLEQVRGHLSQGMRLHRRRARPDGGVSPATGGGQCRNRGS